MYLEGYYMYIYILLYKDVLLLIKVYFFKIWFFFLLISYVKLVKKKFFVYIDWINENFIFLVYWLV